MKLVKQFVALLTVFRSYNLFLLALALYLSAFLILPKHPNFQMLFKPGVHTMIFCSLLCVAAGYLLNFFYDFERDRLVKPIATQLSGWVEKKTLLRLYLGLSILALVMAITVSFEVFLFFLVYQFLLWLYCHKLNKIMGINNLAYALLSIFPFLGLAYRQGNINELILLNGLLLFFAFYQMDLLKDFISAKVDGLYRYKTLLSGYPVVWVKVFSACMVVLQVLICYRLYQIDPKFSRYYYLSICLWVIPYLIYFFTKQNTKNYSTLLWVWKLCMFVGLVILILSHINELI
ncbi:MAG: hypothetical protein C4K58_04560 [Flavobacteriaceae bacterium]|nr:MAG: hypothetical protein C4K58_04560 [Flavobacteriaceae bacterium]